MYKGTFIAGCEGLVVLDSKRCLKMDLGVRTGLKCNTCTYMSETTLPFYYMYEEVCKDKNAPSPAAAKLNIQLQVGLTKNPIKKLKKKKKKTILKQKAVVKGLS